jgi:hypothetical protein
MKNVRLETLGDSGILLDVHLHSNEECVRLDLERTRSTLKYWTEVCVYFALILFIFRLLIIIMLKLLKMK